MANSKYEYVRSFEQPDSLLPNTFVVVRIDGRAFTKLTAKYKFVKPNDRRALDLMNAAAEAVMKDLPDLVLAYGQSDEFSFVFPKDCMLFERRASKLTTTIVSTFTANYVLQWSTFFPDAPLTAPLPSFDGRAVAYPSDVNLRDYLSWRQVDCHINNLYNTTFWALVQKGGMDPRSAEQELSGTLSADKNEILFSRFGINYNNEPEIFKKGSVLYRDFFPTSTQSSPIPYKTNKSPTPPLSQPRPKRIARPMSQPLERSTFSDLLQDSPINTAASSPRGPTFLSTSTTPSPPPSPPPTLLPTVANPLPEGPPQHYPQTFLPISPPAQNGNAMRQALPQLTPLPLPPPTLKPSTRPPPSLNPPNPTTYTSPLSSPTAPRSGPSSIPQRTTSNHKRPPKAPSHSAHASLSTPRPLASQPAHKPSPKRSPSMSALDFGPPQIPLRISSIPLNAPPRKLSLPSQKSYSLLRQEEKENAHAYSTTHLNSPPTVHTLHALSTSHRKTPPPHLKTMKELPSPPPNDSATRNAVMGSEPPVWTASPPPSAVPPPPPPHDTDINRFITNPIIPPSPSPPRTRPRGCSHSRLNSAPPTAGASTYPTPISTGHASAGPSSAYAYNMHTATTSDKERARRERDDRIRFAHFDWSPTQLSPLDPFPSPPTSPDAKDHYHQQQHFGPLLTSATTSEPPLFARSRSSPSLPTAHTTPSRTIDIAPDDDPYSRQPPPPVPRKSPERATPPPLATKSLVPSSIPPIAPLNPKPKTKAKDKAAKHSSSSASSVAAAKATTISAPGLAEDGSWAAPTRALAAGDEEGAGGGGGSSGFGGGSTTGRPVHKSKTQREKEKKRRLKARIVVEHVDIIRDAFWERRPWILSGRVG